MRIENTLEKLTELFRNWGLTQDDWCLIGEWAMILQGYSVKRREGILDVFVDRKKLPWKVKEERQAVPPKSSNEAKALARFSKQTGFEVDITPLAFGPLKRARIKDSVFYRLSSGQKLRLATPLSEVLGHGWKFKFFGEQAGEIELRRWGKFLKGIGKTARKKGERRLVEFCDQLLNKYAYLMVQRKLKIEPTIKILEGISACLGKARGRARVIIDSPKADLLKKEEILVTRMTSPRFTQVIGKAAGIVTDEGGKLCHAAILAREFDIPCVVGTKIATKVLKNEELIEVDATRGVVKRLPSRP